MFAAAVSLVTGKILYISDQVASIFHCRRDAFYGARFVEFLAPHDVSVFHTFTTPYKLPPWSVCSGPGEGLGRRPGSGCLGLRTRGTGNVGAAAFPGPGPGWSTWCGARPSSPLPETGPVHLPDSCPGQRWKATCSDKLRKVVFSQISEREHRFRRL